MKAYTDLEQSKKLADILPLESADFFWIIGHLHTDGPRYEIIRPRNEVSEVEKYWPCWSLAALLEIIPKDIEGLNRLRIDLDNEDFSIWYDDLKGYGVNDKLPDITLKEPIDACYEMIATLKEKGLL